MKRKNDTLESKIYRMFEFFTKKELWKFKEFIVDEKYNEYDAWTYLDMQTRVDYFIIDNTPKINDYILKYIKYKKNGMEQQ